MSSPSSEKVVVIGAGPVGALAALYAAKRGYNVEVYELRSDLRLDNTSPLNFTKSINLALSERGIQAIRSAQCPALLDAVLADALPMHGRMIHGLDSKGRFFEQSQKYDAHGRFIRACDRSHLNKTLLHELSRHPNVRLHFSHKLTGFDLNRRIAWLEDRSDSSGPNQTALDHQQRPTEKEIPFHLLLGADGAWSPTRQHLQKYARLNYSQSYIQAMWCEFTIPPSPQNEFRLSHEHLHIWPKGDFMFIAIPNRSDRSFTCTLFMPGSLFSDLDAQDAADTESNGTSPVEEPAIASFFRENFPSVIEQGLIGPDDLARQYRRNPHLPLVSISCTPYHYRDSCVILGDAAHAMVPFYGQGMNCGLEDVRVLFDFLDKSDGGAAAGKQGADGDPDLKTPLEDSANAKAKDTSPANSRAREAALAAYTTYRTADTHTITSLSLQNYTEMRSHVLRSPLYKLRKSLEELLSVYAPWTGVQTQYARVSFESGQRYSDALQAVEWQGKWLGRMLGGGLGVLGVGLGLGFWRLKGWVGSFARLEGR
ncbi:MAG: kynurenine 3-monooxygenase, mitochondrial precursor [Alyxoria varia]|nr:MAG: kynurenine 3-monooxygenase, mitochondrial precursor [Alyxoria varia]